MRTNNRRVLAPLQDVFPTLAITRGGRVAAPSRHGPAGRRRVHGVVTRHPENEPPVGAHLAHRLTTGNVLVTPEALALPSTTATLRPGLDAKHATATPHWSDGSARSQLPGNGARSSPHHLYCQPPRVSAASFTTPRATNCPHHSNKVYTRFSARWPDPEPTACPQHLTARLPQPPPMRPRLR